VNVSSVDALGEHRLYELHSRQSYVGNVRRLMQPIQAIEMPLRVSEQSGDDIQAIR
jgi:hypothetical protein